jgi:hypothetical protein
VGVSFFKVSDVLSHFVERLVVLGRNYLPIDVDEFVDMGLRRSFLPKDFALGGLYYYPFNINFDF